MADSVLRIGARRQDTDVDGPDRTAGPPPDPGAAARAVRAAAGARYRAFVSQGSTEDPCLEFSTADHDFDKCVRESLDPSVLFFRQEGDTDVVNVADVQQATLGDCNLLASLAALAATPQGRALIRGAVVENKSDAGAVVSWTVTLHHPESHLFGKTTFREVAVTVSGAFVVGHALPRWDSGRYEIWPLIVEKAYAQYSGGYNAIGRGGTATDAMAVLTGREATYVSLAWPNRWFRGYGADDLKTDLASGKMVVFVTKAGIGGRPTIAKLPPTRQATVGAHQLLGGHGYFATGMEQRNGRLFLKLGNPWGSVQPEPVPYDEITTWFSGVNIGALP